MKKKHFSHLTEEVVTSLNADQQTLFRLGGKAVIVAVMERAKEKVDIDLMHFMEEVSKELENLIPKY